MNIIGTSGHVDHGKSSLIEALSTINPMHLPDEKKRGMTIDLGFAHFKSPQGDTIGIVDVPGHEKFIRNMVAGIWALDCVLLVVALDDGVMPMTTTHLQIAQAMGIDNFIIVGHKSDLYVGQEQQNRWDHILIQLYDYLPSNTPHILVSSKTKDGIEDLRALIFKQLHLKATKTVQDAKKTMQYYIDRVFDIKGSGQVVTGSLVGNSLNKQNNYRLYPSGQSVGIKNLQSYHQNQDEVDPKARVSLALKNAPLLKRGMMLSDLEPNQVLFGAFYVLHIQKEYTTLKNYAQVEVAVGTASTLGIITHLSEGYLFLELKEEISCLPYQSILLISHGGSTLLAHTKALLTLGDKKQKASIKQYIQYLKSQTIDISRSMLLCMMQKGIVLKKEADSLLKPYGTDLQEYFILHWVLEDLQKQINQTIEKNKGIHSGEIASRINIASSPLEALLSFMVQNNKISKEQQGYYPAGANLQNQTQTLEQIKLSLGEKNAFQFIKSKGPDFFSSQEVLQHKASLKDLKNLVALGLVIFLEDEMYLSMDAYLSLEKQILQNKQIGDKFSIQSVKESVGLSRKYSIPILNAMEKRGYVKRSENERIVLKI